MASYKKSTVDSSIPAYPDPEPFAVPGPCWSTISHQYFVDSGVLPGPELMQELLQKYWNRIPRTDRSKQPANGDSNFHGHHTEEDPASRNQRSINHNSTQDAARRISTVRFSHNRLALVPFLGPSPAEIYEGPLFATMLFQPTPMLRHTPMLEDSPRPSHKQDGSIKVQTHLPLTPPTSVADDPDSAEDIAIAKPARSPGTKDRWLHGEVEQVAYLREVEGKEWSEIREAS